MTIYAASGSEFNVNSTYIRSQAQSDGAALADGNSIIVWVDADFNTTANRFIRAQIYGADGTPEGLELTLVSGNSFINPAVAGLEGGGFVLTWRGTTTLRAQIFNDAGSPIGPAFDASPTLSSTIGSPNQPDIAALADGGFAISWYDTRTSGADTSGSAVRVHAFDRNGIEIRAETLVNTSTVGKQDDSSIAALPDGGYVVTFTDRGGSSWLIKARIFDSTGTPVGSEFVVNNSTTGVSSVESSVTTLANGTFAVAWYESDFNLGSGHRVQIFSASGARIGSQITVPSDLTGIQVGPTLVALSDGGFAIAWKANVAPLSDGSGTGVFVQTFDAGAQATGDPMLVNTQTAGDQILPSIVSLESGGFIVHWTDVNGAGADDDQIKAQIFTPQHPVTIISNGGSDSAIVIADENQPGVTTVVATAGGSPANITYAIDGGDDAALFTIDPATGVLSFANAPDYEAPGGNGDNLYNVQIRASNAVYSDIQALTVSVANVNEAPVITSDGGGTSAAFSVVENSTVVTTVTAADIDGDGVSYSIVGGPDANLFAIDAESGVLTFAAAPDFEAPADFAADNFYKVIVSASDGSLSATQAIEILVNNVNEAVDISSYDGDASAVVNADENEQVAAVVTATDLDGDTVSYALAGGADEALFTVNSATGELSFKTAPNFEAPVDADGDNIYDVIVAATDGSLSDTQALSIAVGNVNEAPTALALSNTSVAENASNGTVVGIASGTDPDAGDSLSYSLADAAGGRFAINASSGEVSVANGALLDYEAASSHSIMVRVTDAQGVQYDEAFTIALTDVLETTRTYTGTSAANIFTASSNDNWLVKGLGGNDTLTTHNGRDLVSGGTGDDTIATGGNDDLITFNGASEGYDTIDGGAGNDDQIQALSDNTVIGLRSLVNVEAISANGFNNIKILGSSAANTLDFSTVTLTSISLIDGGAGNDNITGSNAADTIVGNTGNDSLTGGEGDDLFLINATSGIDVINGGNGLDTIRATAANAVLTWGTISGIDAIDGGGFSGVKIVGTSGADMLDFSAVALTGIALIDAGAGNDSVIGTDNADIISGGTGVDNLSGGEGNDQFRITTNSGLDTINGGDGLDIIRATAANTVLTWSGISNIEAVDGGGFAGVKIIGTSGADTLDFSALTLTGISRIEGGAGNDNITGSSDADTLVGGAGADVLRGGLGADLFDFNLISESAPGLLFDRISDFELGIDRIDLASIDANTAMAGDQLFSFIGNSAFSGARGELRFDTGTVGETRVLADLDGNTIADFEIRLIGTHVLHSTDFIL